MADELPQQKSISARIAALKLEQVGRTPVASTVVSNGKGVDTPITRPAVDIRRHTANNPPIQTNGVSSTRKIGNQPIGVEDGASPRLPPRQPRIQDKLPSLPPRLPPRDISTRPKPQLPPRKPSEASLKKRSSIESVSSTASTFSSISTASTGITLTPVSRTPSVDVASKRIKAPVYDPATLPPLPSKRNERLHTVRGSLKSLESSPAGHDSSEPQKLLQQKPPRLPLRRIDSIETGRGCSESNTSITKSSALSLPLNESTEPPPALPSRRPNVQPQSSTDLSAANTPPPIPLASRPSVTQSILPPARRWEPIRGQCLKCRNFSEPDRHAARFPRESIPSTSIEWLSHQLTSPFPSLTDKARVIFTWLHYNIEYDVESFFNHSVKPSTPSNTLSSGLAVCEGYAGLFSALAMKASLESVVISGHGKGYGFTPVGPNSPIPPYSAGHAWNAVKIDGGEWKLIDCCWGAGHVSGKGQPYTKQFTPSFFTMSNTEFGLRHFPGNKTHFYLPAQQVPPSWEEYVLGGDMAGKEPVQVFGGAETDHGINPTSILPKLKTIPVSFGSSPPNKPATIRFSFSAICPHWSNEVMGKGKPYPFILSIHGGAGPNGGKSDFLPFHTTITNDAGQIWWRDDVPVDQLGRPGQTVTLFAVTTVDGVDARGMTMEEYCAVKGKKGMSFAGVAAWVLV